MNWKEDGEVTSSQLALPQLIRVILRPADEKLAMAGSWQATPFGRIDPICNVWIWQGVMYDLCTRPEQPEPAAAHAETGSREVADALGGQAQDLGGTKDQEDKSNEPSGKAVHTTANGTTTSLLGKRHHSLYANLNGFEVEGVRKVSVLYCWCCLIKLKNRIRHVFGAHFCPKVRDTFVGQILYLFFHTFFIHTCRHDINFSTWHRVYCWTQ